MKKIYISALIVLIMVLMIPKDVNADVPGKTTLSSPVDQAPLFDSTPTFTWEKPTTGTEPFTYEIQIDDDINFTSLDFTQEDVNETTITLSSALTEGVYYWRVRTSNTEGDGEWSDIRSFTIMPATKPSIPLLKSPVDQTIDVFLTPTLEWYASSGTEPISYVLQLDTTDMFAPAQLEITVSSTIYTLPTELSDSTTYYWRVKSTNVVGGSDWSDVRSFTTGIAPSTPQLYAPSNAVSNITLTPYLDWLDSTGTLPITYNLHVATDSLFNNIVINLSNLTETSYSVPRNKLSEGTTYYWRVQAYSEDFGTSNFSEVWSFSTGTRPSMPVLSSPTTSGTISTEYVIFEWDVSSGSLPITYEIQVSRDTSFSYLVEDVEGILESEYTVISLPEIGTYYWRIRAKNAIGTSSWTETWNFEYEPVEGEGSTSIDMSSRDRPTEQRKECFIRQMLYYWQR